jgi:Polyketide cyclase / dehydrase and lipid transport
MPEVFTSTVVGAPVDEVWSLLRDFAAIGSWHPALPPCEIEDGPADRVGCVRVFPLEGDHRETLVSLDDKRRAIAFRFGDNAAGLRVRRYLSTMAIRPITLSDHTYVEWAARFDCDESDEDKVITQVRDGVLIPGLKALEQRFGPGS